MQQPQFTKDIVLRFIAIIVGFVVAFVIAEVGIRIISPQKTGQIKFVFNQELGLIPVPNQQGRRTWPKVYDYTYSHNSYGFRGSKEYTLGENGNFRVLLLGDSFTYGIGVNDDQTFAHYIQKNLSNSFESVEVINAGNEGKGTGYELKLFQTLGHKLSPDIVVLCFFSNDFYNNEHNEYFHVDSNGKLHTKPLSSPLGGIKALLLNMPSYNWIISWSHAANLLIKAVYKHTTSNKSAIDSNIFVNSHNIKMQRYANNENIKLTDIFIKNLKANVNSNGGKLIIFYIPNSHEIKLYRKSKSISMEKKSCHEYC